MADEKPKAQTGSAAQKSPDKPVEEQRYDVDYLRSHARGLLKTNEYLVAGALSLQDKKTFTLEEAELLVKEYAQRPVENVE